MQIWWGPTPWVVIAEPEAAHHFVHKLLVRPEFQTTALLRGELHDILKSGLVILQ